MTSDAGLSSQDTDYARHIQEVLSELQQMQQLPQLVHHWPKPLKNDGKVKVRVRTAQGDTVPVWVDLLINGVSLW